MQIYAEIQNRCVCTKIRSSRRSNVEVRSSEMTELKAADSN